MSAPAKPRAAQSFRADEVSSVQQLFRLLRRGGDVRALLRSDALRSVERKFIRMREPRTSAPGGDA